MYIKYTCNACLDYMLHVHVPVSKKAEDIIELIGTHEKQGLVVLRHDYMSMLPGTVKPQQIFWFVHYLVYSTTTACATLTCILYFNFM